MEKTQILKINIMVISGFICFLFIESKTSGYNKLFEINTLLYTSLKVSVNNNVVDDDGNEKYIIDR